jgi:DNA-directed RNA polymerase subunit RPC12/RpoP
MNPESLNPASFECPHCSTALKIAPEMRGTAVQCAACKGKMLIPELIPAAPSPVATGGEVLARTCPGCENPFGVTEEMLGTKVLCPHCGFAIELLSPNSPVKKTLTLLDAKLEQDVDNAKKRFRGYRPAKLDPLPKISRQAPDAVAPDVPATVPRVAKRPITGRSNAADRDDTLAIELAQLSFNSEQVVDSDDLALRELARPARFVARELDVSHLLPPKFHTSDPSMIRIGKKLNDESFVLLPDSTGGFQRVNNSLIRVEHGGEMITLCAPDKRNRIRRRLLINAVSLFLCVVILYLAFRWLIR